MYEPAGAPMRSCTTSTNAATSWSVTFSRSSTSATKTSSTVGRLGPAGGRVVRRHDAQGGLRLGGQQLDLEPEREAGGVAEQRGHVGRRVARDHPAPSRARTAEPGTRAAMSRRICMPSQSIGAAAA